MAENDQKPASPPPSGGSPSLESVEARLSAVRGERADKAAKEASQANSRQGMSLGMRIGVELLASVLGGLGIGLLLDKWLETMPIFTLAFVSIGFAAGVLSVLRLSRGLDERIGLGRAVREKQAADAAAGKQGETPPSVKGAAPPKAWDDDDE